MFITGNCLLFISCGSTDACPDIDCPYFPADVAKAGVPALRKSQRKMIGQDGRLFNRVTLGEIALIYELPHYYIIYKKAIFIFCFDHNCVECRFTGLCDHRHGG